MAITAERRPVELHVDAGQTRIKIKVVLGSEILSEAELPGIVTSEPLLPQLELVARQVTDAGHRVGVVCIGTTGLGDDRRQATRLKSMLTTHGVAEVFIAHDSVTSFLGALGDNHGVVVAAGTGVVTMAVGESNVARVDGWGYLIGDAGSGYWLGRAALDAVMRAHDGRGAATIMTDLVSADFVDLEQAYIELQADAGRVHRIAGFSRLVTEVADQDEVAGAICDHAAVELALAAETGLRRVGQLEQVAPLVSCIGGVFGAAAIKDRFDDELRRRLPSANLVLPAGSGLDGASRLPRIARSSALSDLILRSQ